MSDTNKYISKMSFNSELYYLKDNEARKDITDLKSGKVDSVEGKGLSTNDFTDEYKSAIDNGNQDISEHINDTDNPHNITKTTIGLENVDNKSSATIRSEISSANVTNALGYIPLNSNLKGAANGLAELDADGKVPSSQLPSYVDDVVEYDNLVNFPRPGESGKVYVATASNITYRWTGSTYAAIGSDLALGETEATAYRGDRGKTAYDHSQADHAPADAEKNTIVGIKANDTAVDIDENRYVNISIPTKVSDLTNDEGYITEEYEHPSHTAASEGLYKVTVDGLGHVTNTTAVTKEDISALGISTTDTTYETGTGTVSGLTKIYDSTGENTDGTINQKTITTELGKKANTSDLGTAAMTDSTAYATAEQGSTADSAVQSVKIGDTEYKVGTSVVLPAYPSSLPASDISDWAKADEKPSYTASEVGALPSTTTLADLSTDDTHRTVTDAEKTAWNSKVDAVEGSSLVSNTDITQITTNKNDISTLKGTGDGSIDKMISDKIDAWASALTDDGVVNTYTEAINWIASHASDYTTLLGDVSNKVDKVSGKGLSTEDFTTLLKTKLEGINVTDTYSATGTDPVSGKAVAEAISGLANEGVLGTHTSNKENPHEVTASQVGLGNLTNDKQVKGNASGTTTGNVVSWGADGYSLTDTGFTIGKSVPADAVFTDTTYGTGSKTEAGLTKLYDSTGENTDGTMDQKTISTELGKKANTSDLGTAAMTDSTAYATAAQGAKADTALQSFTETDPTVPSYVKDITEDDISMWTEGGKIWIGTHAKYEEDDENIPVGTRILFTDDNSRAFDMSNYYTKDDIDQMIDIVPKIKLDTAQTLSEITSPDANTIYLIPDNEASDIMFREYLYVNNVWKLIGVQRSITANVDDNGILTIG